MPVKFYTEQEYMEMVRERNGLQSKVEVLEQLRPVWAQGHTSEQVAAQMDASALAHLWHMLGAQDQTQAVHRIHRLITIVEQLAK